MDLALFFLMLEDILVLYFSIPFFIVNYLLALWEIVQILQLGLSYLYIY
jgi:hypothetical protein